MNTLLPIVTPPPTNVALLRPFYVVYHYSHDIMVKNYYIRCNVHIIPQKNQLRLTGKFVGFVPTVFANRAKYPTVL